MGICQTSSIKYDKNDKNDNKGEKSIQNTDNLDKSKTVRMFDSNQNKMVEVQQYLQSLFSIPVLVPATQNSLYSKRQSHSPISNPNSRQLVAQSS